MLSRSHTRGGGVWPKALRPPFSSYLQPSFFLLFWLLAVVSTFPECASFSTETESSLLSIAVREEVDFERIESTGERRNRRVIGNHGDAFFSATTAVFSRRRGGRDLEEDFDDPRDDGYDDIRNSEGSTGENDNAGDGDGGEEDGDSESGGVTPPTGAPVQADEEEGDAGTNQGQDEGEEGGDSTGGEPSDTEQDGDLDATGGEPADGEQDGDQEDGESDAGDGYGGGDEPSDGNGEQQGESGGGSDEPGEDENEKNEPTAAPLGGTAAPVPVPVQAATSAPTRRPSHQHTTKTARPQPTSFTDYIPPEDDPLKESSDDKVQEQWQDKSYVDMAKEEYDSMVHDRNVIIVASVFGALGFVLLIITAQQMIENPDGCCAKICRCSIAFWRVACWPCRKLCGCEKKRRGHAVVAGGDDDGYAGYSHDLELT